MSISSNSLRQIPTSWHEPALPAFAALYNAAQRMCSTQHGLPVAPGDEMRLWAWRLCWLALDAASAPANNLPDIADSQAWPPELIEQLRAAPALPKLNAQTWQELRRARDQQLFAVLPPQEPAAVESIANEALAAMLAEVLPQLGLGQLRVWITPLVTAAITQWLSACLLAIDALALSDDNTDAAALELVVFVQATLQRVHGTVVADNAAQSELEQPAAVSDGCVLEAVRGGEPAAALEPQPAVIPAATPAALELVASNVAVDVSVPRPAGAIEQPPSTSTEDDTRVNASQAATRPRRLRPRAIAQVASVVAVGALLLFMFKTGDVAAPPARPAVTTPDSSAHVKTPEPPVVEPVPNAPVTELKNKPQPSIKQPTSITTQRPRFRNLAAAKRAHAAKKIDDVAYAAAIAELEALRKAKLAKEQLELRRGKLSQHDYQRRVDAINRNLGFDRP